MPPGESRWVCRQDGRTPDHFTVSAIPGGLKNATDSVVIYTIVSTFSDIVVYASDRLDL